MPAQLAHHLVELGPDLVDRPLLHLGQRVDQVGQRAAVERLDFLDLDTVGLRSHDAGRIHLAAAAIDESTAVGQRPRALGDAVQQCQAVVGNCRHGDIQAKVVVTDGRISSATINQCLTRYSCSWIDALPPQVVARQSPNVDYVSGATQSTDAFYWAVVDALLKAK